MNSKLTRERLQEIAEDGFLKHGESKELARMALAAMDSEPVAYMYDGEDGTEYNGHNEFSGGWKGIPLYRHAQQPVDSEPVGYLFHNEYGAVLYSISDDATEGFSLIGPIYSAPQPAPVVPCKWIPVSERMPDENAEQQVLACFKGGDISTLYYFEGRWDDAYGIVPIRQDVTHWQSLPEPPQEDKP